MEYKTLHVPDCMFNNHFLEFMYTFPQEVTGEIIIADTSRAILTKLVVFIS